MFRSLSELLDSLPSSPNTFLALDRALHREFYSDVPMSMQTAAFVFLGILTISMMACITCLWVRIRRGEFWLYTPTETLFTPNTMIHWLIWHTVFVVMFSIQLAFPYVLLGCLRIQTNLSWAPIWMGMIFVPAFWAIWHGSWGLSVGAYLQHSRLQEKELKYIFHPAILNIVFVVGFMAGPASLLTTTILVTLKWNEGFGAFWTLHEQLLAAGEREQFFKITLGEFVSKVPQAQQLLDIMFDKLYNFENPFYVCAALSAVGAMITVIAAIAQGRYIRGQLSLMSSLAESKKRSDSECVDSIPTQRIQLRRTFISVLLVSFALAASAFAYTIVCLLGDLWIKPTPIFNISNAGSLHMYLYQFGFATLDLVVTSAIVFQTFDSKSTSATSQYRRESIPRSLSQNSRVELVPSAVPIGKDEFWVREKGVQSPAPSYRTDPETV
ncbi:hypothetical protein T439DRAFT_366953 [Meredithblackwellia eburnea MCA 4105]